MQIKAPPYNFGFLLYPFPFLRLHYSPVHAKSMLKILMKTQQYPGILLSPLTAGASVDILENKCIFGGCNNNSSSLF